MSRESRANSRLAAVQALYQMDVAGKGLHEILAEFETFWIGREVEGELYKPAEVEFFRDVLNGVLGDQRSIDQDIDATLAEGWPLRRVEAVMRAVLRAGAYELKKRKDIPARVVITEYVDVAAAFLAKDEVGMTNAVLDALARKLRAEDFDK
jgi:N utilization substance protein B